MFRIQDYHLHLPSVKFQFDNSRDLKLLYALRVFRDLVNRSTLFFLPIFLYNFGQNFPILSSLDLSNFQRGMLGVAAYLFAQGFFGMIFAIPSGRMIGKIGFQRTLTIAMLLRILGFTALYYSQTFHWAVFLAMVLEGIQSPMFWNSYHTILSRFAKKHHMGQDLGVLQFLLQMVAVISPAIGGILAVNFGMEILFLVGLVGTLLATIVVMMMDLKAPLDKVGLIEFKRWWSERRYRNLALSFSGRYFNDIALFVWPLYVFLIIGGVDRVGYLYTFSLFLAMVMSFFIGSWIDKNRDRKPFKFSGGLLSILWILRSQVLSVWNIAIVDTFEKIVGNFHWLFYDSLIIGRGKGSQALSYFVYREIIIGITATTFWILVGVIILVFETSWLIVFSLAAVGVLLSLYAKQKDSLDG